MNAKLEEAGRLYRAAKDSGQLTSKELTFDQAIQLCNMLGEAMVVMKDEAEAAAAKINRMTQALNSLETATVYTEGGGEQEVEFHSGTKVLEEIERAIVDGENSEPDEDVD